jgi:chromosome segregation ATPase
MVEDYCAAAVELRRLHAENAAQRTELVAEAARTAEEKLRADQMTEQHRMQTNMRKELEQKVASLQEELSSRDSWLAECRDAFSLPAVNTELDHHFCSAMTGPSEVPAYVVAQAKSLEAQLSAIGAGGVEALRKPAQEHATQLAGQGQKPAAWLASYQDREGNEASYVTTHYQLALENDARGQPVALYRGASAAAHKDEKA